MSSAENVALTSSACSNTVCHPDLAHQSANRVPVATENVLYLLQSTEWRMIDLGVATDIGAPAFA